MHLARPAVDGCRVECGKGWEVEGWSVGLEWLEGGDVGRWRGGRGVGLECKRVEGWSVEGLQAGMVEYTI